MADAADDNLSTTYIVAIVVGSTGFVLMILGAVYYCSRLGDVPSRRAVGSDDECEEPLAPSKDVSMQEGSEGSSGRKAPLREELIEVYAPAGKLGVVLEDSLEEYGPPLVHELREFSVLKEELQVGDKIIALDDEDVRKMSANKVSKLISQRMDHPTRKLSIIRTIHPNV